MKLVRLELSIDMSSAGHQPIPTVTIEDLDETSRLEGQGVAGEVVPKQSETQGDKVSGHVVGVVRTYLFRVAVIIWSEASPGQINRQGN